LLTGEFNKTDGETPPRKTVVAVDGLAASGKGTLAKGLATALGFAYLDTGAIYRAVALATLKLGGDPSKLEDVRPAIEFVKNNISAQLLADPALRTEEIAEAVPKVAAMPEVREAVRGYQEEFMRNPPGGEPGVVLDGRDIGTVVCPDAEVKFFVTASAEERARRRFLELKVKNPALTQGEVLDDINARDSQDIHRKHSPLVAAADAHVLDTTSLNKAEALAEALDVVTAKLSPPAAPAAKPPKP
jgi:CMP/dCMP kinase